MLRLFFIGLGGAIGALLRYWASGAAQGIFHDNFPGGTLTVNLLGSLVIGFLWGTFESVVVSQNIRIFLFIGMLGSFTTLSTFSLESFHLLRNGEYVFCAINIMLSFIASICLVFAGYLASQYLFNLVRR